VSLVEDIQESFRLATNCQQAACEGLNEFQAACLVGDEGAAEAARARVIGSYEAFMDNWLIAYRRMRQARSGIRE